MMIAVPVVILPGVAKVMTAILFAEPERLGMKGIFMVGFFDQTVR